MGLPYLRASASLPAFGFGHFSRSLIWSFSDLLLGYYAHIRLGLSAWDTGILLSASLAYSSLLDLVLAFAFVRMTAQHQRVPRLQLAGGVATAISGVLLFLPVPGGLSHALAWMIVTSVLFRTSYALYDLSQNALISLLPRNAAELTRFAALRAIVAPAARLCMAGFGFLLIGEPASRTWGHETTAAIAIGIMIVISAWLLGRQRPAPDARERAVRRLSEFPAARMSPLLIATVATCLLALPGRFLPFTADTVPGYCAGAMLTFAMVLGSVAGPFVATHMVRTGRQRAIVMLGGLSIGTAMLLMAIPVFPLQLTMALLYGVGLGGTSVVVWNDVAGAVRDHAARTGQRTDLTCFALLTMTIKMSIALSNILLGHYLDGFRMRQPDTLAGLAVIAACGGLVYILVLLSDRFTLVGKQEAVR